MNIGRSIAVAVLGVSLAGCADNAARQTELADERNRAQWEIGDESILDLFGRSGGDPERSVAVNRFLWAASLDTLSFLPIEAADPFTGVIATDWGRVSGDATPYRVTVLITDPALDARSLRVSAFRQQGGRAVAVAEADNRQIEDAILTRARQLRVAERGR